MTALILSIIIGSLLSVALYKENRPKTVIELMCELQKIMIETMVTFEEITSLSYVDAKEFSKVLKKIYNEGRY